VESATWSAAISPFFPRFICSDLAGDLFRRES
jgi:hypothetical protein